MADGEPNPTWRQILGGGINKAHEAINALKRISKNDKHRNQGFQMVSDWIESNWMPPTPSKRHMDSENEIDPKLARLR